jgi:hypothetical protein
MNCSPPPVPLEVAFLDIVEVPPAHAIHAGSNRSVVGQHMLKRCFHPFPFAQEMVQIIKTGGFLCDSEAGLNRVAPW